MAPEKDPFDPHVIALRQVELEGALGRVSDALTNATQNMGSALQSVQVDIRGIAKRMENLVPVVERQQRLDDEIERAFEAIQKLAETSKENWDDHHLETSKEKEIHEKEIRASREKLILWGGIGLGISLLAATLTAIVAWSVNSRFDNQSRDHDKLDLRIEKHIEESVGHHEEHEDKIEKIEKTLIRSGQLPPEPYNGGNK